MRQTAGRSERRARRKIWPIARQRRLFDDRLHDRDRVDGLVVHLPGDAFGPRVRQIRIGATVVKKELNDHERAAPFEGRDPVPRAKLTRIVFDILLDVNQHPEIPKREAPMKLVGKTALVTGGNSGIGLEAARLFVNDGARVIITGRDKTKLDEVTGQLGPKILLRP
jgi:hypothetical protein